MNRIMNGKIEFVTLSMRDHGCLTYGLGLKFAGGGCVYGGMVIGHGYLGADKFEGSAKGLEAMMQIMNVVGVNRWEDLEGRYIRVEDPGLGKVVSKIGNIIEDKWFDQKEFFAED